MQDETIGKVRSPPLFGRVNLRVKQRQGRLFQLFQRSPHLHRRWPRERVNPWRSLRHCCRIRRARPDRLILGQVLLPSEGARGSRKGRSCFQQGLAMVVPLVSPGKLEKAQLSKTGTRRGRNDPVCAREFARRDEQETIERERRA